MQPSFDRGKMYLRDASRGPDDVWVGQDNIWVGVHGDRCGAILGVGSGLGIRQRGSVGVI